jgi:CubicO group peptidase (beta-lactamase class C family)
MLERLSTLPLECSPGTAWNYSVSIDLIGYLIQMLSGLSFREFLRTRLFEPLGVTDTGFGVHRRSWTASLLATNPRRAGV